MKLTCTLNNTLHGCVRYGPWQHVHDDCRNRATASITTATQGGHVSRVEGTHSGCCSSSWPALSK